MIPTLFFYCNLIAKLRAMFNYEAQRKRSELYRNLRRFFWERGYLEVETPLLSPYLIPEPTIKAFGTRFESPFDGRLDLCLLPSPEYYMKQLLADGAPSIFQITKCFRNSEQLGEVHNPEFTMLEYYTLGFDEMDTLRLTEEMLRETALGDGAEWVRREPLVVTMREAVLEYSGVDLLRCQEPEEIRAEAERLGLYVPDGEAWDDTFNRIFLTFVEPSIPKDRQVYITDYPYQIDCLAQRDGCWRKRWELYINGIEIANTYSEETDPETTARYFEKEQRRLEEERRLTGEVISSADPAFPALSIPRSSGGAMGLDRLLAVMLGYDTIQPLLLFPLSDMIARADT